MSRRDSVPVTGIHLVRLGKHVVVLAEMDGEWVEVIRELHDSMFSHIVEPAGMRARQDEAQQKGLHSDALRT